jgi:hypothetical protein
MLPLLENSHLTIFRHFIHWTDVLALIIIEYRGLITLINQLYDGWRLHPIGFSRFDKLSLLLTLLKGFSRTVSEHHHGFSLCWGGCRLLRLLHYVTYLGRVLINSLVRLALYIEVSRRISRIQNRDSVSGKFSFLKISESRTSNLRKCFRVFRILHHLLFPWQHHLDQVGIVKEASLLKIILLN